MRVIKKEIWADVPGYKMIYKISTLGRIKSMYMTRMKGYDFFLKHQIGHRGYPSVSLCHNCKRKTFDIHVLLAKTFMPNPCNLPEVNHIDGNKLNYSLSNLEWISDGGNLQHAYDNGLKPRPLGEKNVKAKVTSKLVMEIFETKMSCRAIARKYGLNKTLVENIKSGRTWSHVTGKKFESVTDKMATYTNTEKAPRMWEKNKDLREKYTKLIHQLKSEGLTGRQIAKILGVSNGTVASKLKTIEEVAA
jgi:hypothetical protein